MSVCYDCFVLSGRGLCGEPDHLSRGVLPTVVSLSVCVCVCVCVCERERERESLSVVGCNNNPTRLQWVGRRGQTEKKKEQGFEKWAKIYLAFFFYDFVTICQCSFLHVPLCVSLIFKVLPLPWMGREVAKWLRHYATYRQVAGSIPDGVIGIFQWHNPSGRGLG